MSFEYTKSQCDTIEVTTITLANAADLIASVIKDIAGDDIASTLNEGSLTRELVADMACREMVKEISSIKV